MNPWQKHARTALAFFALALFVYLVISNAP